MYTHACSIWDGKNCPLYQGVLISECPDYTGNPLPQTISNKHTYMYRYTCIHTHTYIITMYAHTRTYTLTLTHTCTYSLTLTHTRTYTLTLTHTRTYTLTLTHTCTYSLTHVCTCTHTVTDRHTHTNNESFKFLPINGKTFLDVSGSTEVAEVLVTDRTGSLPCHWLQSIITWATKYSSHNNKPYPPPSNYTITITTPFPFYARPTRPQGG